MTVRILHGDLLQRLIERSAPVRTYWPTLRLGEYDATEQLTTDSPA
jgi:hypothetical protein